MGADTFLGKLNPFGGGSPVGQVGNLTAATNAAVGGMQPEPPEAPDAADGDAAAGKELKRKGRAATVLSGYRGVEGPTNPGVRKTLLGG